MPLKDYYSILQLPPAASPPEIKKAYRKLAQQYHPDKNNNDAYAAMQFAEIKEAYEVLINPAKKEYYLQQRWYNQSAGKKFSAHEPFTPPTVLKQCLELNRYVTKLDIHRMDKEGLYQYMGTILSDSTVSQLIAFNEPEINKQIIISVLKTTEYLEARQAASISKKLLLSAGSDETVQKMILAALHRYQQKQNWQKYQTIMLIIATAVICLLIYLVSH